LKIAWAKKNNKSEKGLGNGSSGRATAEQHGALSTNPRTEKRKKDGVGWGILY
jgi:hypothetical protein